MPIKSILANILLASALSLSLSFAQAANLNDGYKAAIKGDYDEAFTIIRAKAIDGDANAQFTMAMMYHSGLGVKMDEQEAVKWYLTAAENGSIKAMEFISAGYENGWFGLPRDAERAKYWYDRMEEAVSNTPP
ncbi:MAG: sel1 repeat family protein [Gammaproteobacteria bacterium]|nr:sel1 repeat family protein [Gammaproteobacteria bacterium]